MKKTSEVVPVVGMGACYGIGSDCYPYTVVKILSPCRIQVQTDNYKPTEKHEGPFGKQDYTYEPNPQGDIRTFTLRKNGRWYEMGSSMKYGCLTLNFRKAYFDPHL